MTPIKGAKSDQTTTTSHKKGRKNPAPRPRLYVSENSLFADEHLLQVCITGVPRTNEAALSILRDVLDCNDEDEPFWYINANNSLENTAVPAVNMYMIVPTTVIATAVVTEFLKVPLTGLRT